MHSRIRELTQHLDATRDEVRRAVDSVPGALRDRTPPGGGWTVAEVIDHLARAEKGTAGIFAKHVDEARSNGLGPERSEDSAISAFPGDRIRSRVRKVISPDFIEPRAGVSFDDAWQALAASRSAILAAITKADGLALCDVKATHPFLGPLDMYHWVAFAGYHEGRHAAQIEEIAQAFASAGPHAS